MTLQVPTDATDPLNELTEQFNKVVRSEYNASESRQLKTQGVALKNEDDARMYLNKKARRIEVSFYVPLDPEDKRDYKTMFYDKIQEISKCLAINETLIQKSR